MGQGDIGQLGLGEEVVERKRPFPVGGVLAGAAVSQVVCGGMHTVCLTKDGKVREGRREGGGGGGVGGGERQGVKLHVSRLQ